MEPAATLLASPLKRDVIYWLFTYYLPPKTLSSPKGGLNWPHWFQCPSSDIPENPADTLPTKQHPEKINKIQSHQTSELTLFNHRCREVTTHYTFFLGKKL